MVANGTTPIHSFGSRGVRHVLEALDSMGLSADALCRDAGIQSERLRDPQHRVDAEQLLRLFATAERAAGDSLIGLHAAERTRFGGLAGYLVGSQDTVADALQAQDRVQPLLLGAVAVAVRARGQQTHVTLDAGPRPAERRHLTEYCVASSCRLMGWLTARAGRPEEIRFQHEPGGAVGEYERVFGCPVRFGMDENGALLSRATLAARLVSADDELAGALERLARAENGAPPAGGFRGAVVDALRAGRMGRASGRRESVARALGVSARTLQRRLEAEGTTFGEVLDDTRRRVALELMADAALSIGAVSSGVGFADQFAFNKAFRRWTGRSPSAYRRERSGGRRAEKVLK